MSFPFEATRFGSVSTDERLGTKAQALQDGMQNADDIFNTFFDNFTAGTYPPHSPQGIVLGIQVISDLADQYAKLKEKDEQLEVLIGIVGGMGNGKSSILNALLDKRNLLPVGTAAATTAVACRVSWNQSNDPAKAYRAMIKFCTVEDIRDDIKNVKHALDVREIIREEIKFEDDEGIRMEQKIEADSQIETAMEKINAVWNIDEEDVARMTFKQVLALNPNVKRLLDSEELVIEESDLEAFSDRLRPYLDSTSARHGSRDGEKFAAWPLINEVQVFIKSPILRHGIVLVDLPGVGDVSAGRVAVTKDYLSKLDITLVVSRITRAADEPTTYMLIDRYRECQMKLDGKFHNRGLGIVLSQTDGLDVKAFISSIDKDQEQYKTITETDSQLKQLESSISELEHQTQAAKDGIRRWKRDYKKATISNDKNKTGVAKEHKHKIKVQLKSAKAMRATRKQRQSLKSARIETKHKLTYLCTQMRSASVSQRIQADLKRRIEQDDCDVPTEDRIIDIMPVTVMGWWGHELDADDGHQHWGITHPRTTGIPKLKQWIMQRASSTYEKHLDEMLRTFKRIFSQIKDWSTNTCSKDRVVYTSHDIIECLGKIQSSMRWEVKREFMKLNQKVQEMNPITRGKKELLRDCVFECLHSVKLWANKDPACQDQSQMMHWQTYHAIICRGGGPYSSTGSPRFTYNWVEKFPRAVEILEGVVSNWDQTLNKDIPRLGNWMDNRIQSLFLTHMATMTQEIADVLKLRAETVESLEISSEFIPGIMAEVKDQVRTVLVGISKGAADEHPKLLGIIRENFQPTFDRALKIKGKASYVIKRKMITKHAEKMGRKLFNESWTRMAHALERRLNRVPAELEQIQNQAMGNIRNQILIRLWNLIIPRDMGGKNGLSNQKVALQKDIEKRIQIWEAKWRNPSIQPENESNIDEDVGIPTNFGDIKRAAGVGSDDDIEEDSDDVDSDSDSN